MLRINAITSAQGAKQYYTQALAREDYYLNGQEIVGQWQGKGASLLGLAGDVDRDRFFALADNHRPDDGRPLTVRTKEGRRVGYDFTFSVPKSVSLLYALTKDERLLDAFRDSVRDTMQEMEAEVKTRVRKGKGDEQERTTGNMVWADFFHTVGRPVDGVPDPDLHAHCVVFNATYDRKERRWKAGEFHDLKRDAPYYDAAFHARLAERVQALGLGIERNGKRWDVAGIPRELIEKFSNRTKEIEARAKELGITDEAAKGKLGAKTRKAKLRDLDRDSLQQVWESRLTPADWQAIETALSGGTSGASGASSGQEITPEAALGYAVADCFARESVVSDKQLLATALQRGVGQVSPEAVKDQFARMPLLTSVVDGRTLVTTRAIWEEEKAMLAFAREGRGACAALGGLAAHFYRSATLNAGQTEAVKHVLTSPNQVMIIKGKAGTGKTTLMKEAVAQIEARSGKQVITLAPTAAARDVLRAEGFAEAQTVAHLLKNDVLQARAREQVLWIDEAGLLSVPDMGEIFAVAKQLDCRVILSGDSGQHRAVSRGDALRLLEKKAGIRPVEVREVMRQRGEYKQAMEEFAAGNIEHALTMLDDLGWVQEVPTDELADRLVADYLALHDQKEEALIVSPTHKQGNEIADKIRAALKERGELGQEDHEVAVLRNLHLTDAQKTDPVSYQAGQVVQFLQNVPSFKSGSRVRVEGKDAGGNVMVRGNDDALLRLPLERAKDFQVYAPERIALAAGDVIRITQNGKTADGHRISNGTLCKVRSITPDGAITLANGWQLGKDFAHLAQGYSVTSLSSQGKSPQHVLVAQGGQSFAASSREQGYVSLSRGKKSARLYTDNKAELLRRVQESSHRASATELVEGNVSARMKPLDLAGGRKLAAHRFRRYRAHMTRVLGKEATLALAKSFAPERNSLQERKLAYGGNTTMER